MNKEIISLQLSNNHTIITNRHWSNVLTLNKEITEFTRNNVIWYRVIKNDEYVIEYNSRYVLAVEYKKES